MLNYIWAGLIVFSLVFALAADVTDLTQETYRNEGALPIQLTFENGYDAEARRQPATLRIDPETFQSFYDVKATPESTYAATVTQTTDGRELRLNAEATLPEPLLTIRDATNPRDQVLQGTLRDLRVTTDSTAATATITFAPVRFVKLTAVSQAALDFAEIAAEIALGLIGILALFLGLMRIAQDAGVIRALVKVVRPLLGPLFPGVPKDHPAMGLIALNLAANVFGLGNAATPFGIKAMEELQTLNPEEDTATDDMVMLLAMNTASVQLVPPVLLIALLGLEINQVYLAIVLTTGLSLLIGITAAKTLGRLPGYRRTDPLRGASPGESPADASPPGGGSA